ncbi:hypothetical protein GCM10029964_084210 [Kibdelosporangium lantanae]
MSAVRVGWSIAVLAVGAVQLARGWTGFVAAAVFFAAILVTFGCVLLAGVLRIPTGFTVLAVLVVAAAGAYFATGTVESPTDPGRSLSLLDTLTGTVPRLLTAPRPAPATPMLLTPGVLLVVVVSLVAVLGVRGRSLLAPAVGGAALYTAAALLTAGQADPHGLVALALVALIGLGWVVVDRSGNARRIHLVPPIALLAVLAGAAVVVGVIPVANSFEPRKLVKPPVTDLTVASPLPHLAAWANAGGAELFRVRGPEVPLRLVALADYTGATWRAASLYGPVGAVPPPDLPDGTKTSTTDLEITVNGLVGTWLPTAGRTTATSADAVVDPDSGSLAMPAGVTPGLHYTVKSTVDDPGDDVLRTATVPSGTTARRYLALPELPYSLAEYARRTVANARTPFEQAVAIEEVVRNGRRAVVDAPVGSSYARLETFLFGTGGPAGANVGTAEQFASAFAVLARAVGLPTRVVVGFRPVSAGPDGIATVLGRDATAWPEVYFDRWGWVAFDPVSGNESGSSSAARRDVLNRLAAMPHAPPPAATPGPPHRRGNSRSRLPRCPERVAVASADRPDSGCRPHPRRTTRRQANPTAPRWCRGCLGVRTRRAPAGRTPSGEPSHRPGHRSLPGRPGRGPAGRTRRPGRVRPRPVGVYSGPMAAGRHGPVRSETSGPVVPQAPVAVAPDPASLKLTWTARRTTARKHHARCPGR